MRFLNRCDDRLEFTVVFRSVHRCIVEESLKFDFPVTKTPVACIVARHFIPAKRASEPGIVPRREMKIYVCQLLCNKVRVFGVERNSLFSQQPPRVRRFIVYESGSYRRVRLRPSVFRRGSAARGFDLSRFRRRKPISGREWKSGIVGRA